MATTANSTTTTQKPVVDAHLAAAAQHEKAGQHHKDAAHEIGKGNRDSAEKHVSAAADHSEKAHVATGLAVKESGKPH